MLTDENRVVKAHGKRSINESGKLRLQNQNYRSKIEKYETIIYGPEFGKEKGGKAKSLSKKSPRANRPQING